MTQLPDDCIDHCRNCGAVLDNHGECPYCWDKMCKAVDCYCPPVEDGFCDEHFDAPHGWWRCSSCKGYVHDTQMQCSCGEVKDGYDVCAYCEAVLPENEYSPDEDGDLACNDCKRKYVKAESFTVSRS